MGEKLDWEAGWRHAKAHPVDVALVLFRLLVLAVIVVAGLVVFTPVLVLRWAMLSVGAALDVAWDWLTLAPKDSP